eukprot:UN08172
MINCNLDSRLSFKSLVSFCPCMSKITATHLSMNPGANYLLPAARNHCTKTTIQCTIWTF